MLTLPSWWPQRTLRYWLCSFSILVGAMAIQPYLETRLNLNDLRNWLFQALTESPTNPSLPRFAKLILMDDRDYWQGPLAHRSPTNRRYLAKLIRAADAADASAIALDIDMRLADPKAAAVLGHYSVIESEYRAETEDLIRSIGDVSQRRPLVLSRGLRGPIGGPFDLRADVFQVYGICSTLRSDGHWENSGTAEFPLNAQSRQNLSCGYISLMPDKRQIPPPASIVGLSGKLDAFPLALVRAHDSEALARLPSGKLYASYIPEAAARNPKFALSATSLLKNPAAAKSLLQGWPVIIGASWHAQTFGEGPLVDSHDTPIGTVSGVLIHENIAEAVDSKRVYRSLPAWGMTAIDFIVGLGCAAAFALTSSWWRALLALVGVGIVLFCAQWLALQLVGAFIEVFLPVLGLGIHAIADRVLYADNQH